MNKDRRKRIQELIDQLEAIQENITYITCEEEDALDNLPESFKEGEKGERMLNAVSELEDAESAVTEAIEKLISAKNE